MVYVNIYVHYVPATGGKHCQRLLWHLAVQVVQKFTICGSLSQTLIAPHGRGIPRFLSKGS